MLIKYIGEKISRFFELQISRFVNGDMEVTIWDRMG
jgi:hypothetical protein